MEKEEKGKEPAFVKTSAYEAGSRAVRVEGYWGDGVLGC